MSIGLSIRANVVLDNRAYFNIDSRGDGSGVAIMTFTTSDNTQLSLSNNARFYSNIDGTLNSSTIFNSGIGYNIVYLKCPSGSSILTISDKHNILKLGNVISGYSGDAFWSYNGLSPAANVPLLTSVKLNFPNLISVFSPYYFLVDFKMDLTDLKNPLESFYVNSFSPISGNISNIPDSCKIFNIYNSSLIGDISTLKIGLEEITIFSSGIFTGDISQLPNTIKKIALYNDNTISGLIDTLHVGLEYISISGRNNISGDLQNLPSSIKLIEILGSNTIYGSISLLPISTEVVQIEGINTISGSLDFVPSSVTTLIIYGTNVISGGFVGLSRQMTTLQIGGNNIINGYAIDLPPLLNTLNIDGSNTINGTLAHLPRSLIQCYLYGFNNISGTLNTLPPNLVSFSLNGYNTISGNIKDIPISITEFSVGGNNIISQYTTRQWNNSSYIFTLVCNAVGSGLISAYVDQLLIDLNNGPWNGNISRLIQIIGPTNQAPTSNSSAAINSLRTVHNVQVITN